MSTRDVIRRWVAPPGLYVAKDLIRLRRTRGISLIHARSFRGARLHLIPAAIDLSAGLIVDLGANVGDWTAAAAAIPQASVLAVEPFPPLRDKLLERFQATANVRVDGRAVAAAAGEATFRASANSVFGSLLEPEPTLETFYGSSAQTTQVITVPTVTLDELVGPQRVSLLKIDVQGVELQVFEGGRETLAQTQSILIEANFAPHYKGGSHFREVDEALTSHGFVLRDLTDPNRGPDGRILWADAVYTRS